MTPEKEAAIREAAVAAHQATEHYRWLGMMNRPQDPAKAAEQSAEYAVACARMLEARAKLQELQEPTP